MLKVLIGQRLPNTIRNVSDNFDSLWDDSWSKDRVVQQIVRDIDKSEIRDNCIISPVLGQIPPAYLSGGAKFLILLQVGALDEYGAHLDMVNMGSNCEDWVYRISREKDIEVSCTTYDNLWKNKKIVGLCLNDGEMFYNWKD